MGFWMTGTGARLAIGLTIALSATTSFAQGDHRDWPTRSGYSDKFMVRTGAAAASQRSDTSSGRSAGSSGAAAISYSRGYHEPLMNGLHALVPDTCTLHVQDGLQNTEVSWQGAGRAWDNTLRIMVGSGGLYSEITENPCRVGVASSMGMAKRMVGDAGDPGPTTTSPVASASPAAETATPESAAPDPSYTPTDAGVDKILSQGSDPYAAGADQSINESVSGSVPTSDSDGAFTTPKGQVGNDAAAEISPQIPGDAPPRSSTPKTYQAFLSAYIATDMRSASLQEVYTSLTPYGWDVRLEIEDQALLSDRYDVTAETTRGQIMNSLSRQLGVKAVPYIQNRILVVSEQ